MANKFGLDPEMLIPEIIGGFDQLDARLMALESSNDVGWKLSGKQKAILWLGVAALVLACVVVPWADGIHSYAREYGLIFWPPRYFSARLDTARLMTELVAVAGVTVAGVLSCRKAGG